MKRCSTLTSRVPIVASTETPAQSAQPPCFFFKGDAQMEILARRFGKKVRLPPTIQIKHQILLRWLEDQTEKEAAEVRKDRFEKQPGVGMLKGGAKAGQ